MSAFSDEYGAAMGDVLVIHGDAMRWIAVENGGRLAAVAFTGAWTAPEMVNSLEEPGVVATDPVIFVRAADFARRPPRRGDLVERAGATWTVGRALDDGQGGLRLHMLEGVVDDDA